MNNSRRELLLLFILIVIGFMAQAWLRNGLTTFVPLPIFWATALSWTVPRPWRFLIPLSLLSEMMVTLPFGILTLIVFCPWFLMRFFRRVEADISFKFLGVIVLTCAIQFVMLASYDFVQSVIANTAWSRAWPRQMPAAWLITSALLFAVAVLINNYWPREQSDGVSSLSRASRR